MAEKLLNKLKEWWGKIVEWWNHFTSKQKTRLIVIASVVVIAFVVLYAILTRPNYVVLNTYSSAKETSEVKAVLDEELIPYKITEDGLTVKIPRKNLSSANVALGAKGITTKTYTLEEALSKSLSTTEADTQKKYQLYMESHLETDVLGAFENIERAVVTLTLPNNDGTLLSKDEEASCAVMLYLTDDFPLENAANLAKFVATALGNSNTDNIHILDSKANLLFAGEDATSAVGNASNQLGVKKDAEAIMNSDVRKVLAGTGSFSNISVATNLVIDFSSTEKTTHNYTPAEGQSQGVLGEETSYTSDSTGGTSGVPGTDSQTETGYVFRDNDYSTSTIEEFYKKYLPNEYIESTTIPAGVINYSNSSLAVSAIHYVVVSEDDLKAQGILDGITWEEYKNANSERKVVPVSEELISLASSASGIPASKISILAYDENLFVDSEGLGIDIYDALQIGLIVVILILLAVVVFKSMHTEKNTEEAEELSVETLLQSNPEPGLDDISVEESSETKKLIEKFVDENPEAAANLLRNWLNEEWG